MSSLSAHLRQPACHGNLPFHAGCPVCRTERLAGIPPGDELLSARSRAGLAAALLATTTAPTAPAWGGEADSEQEGAANDGVPGDHDPAFGEGGTDTDLPAGDGAELPMGAPDAVVEQSPPREVLPDPVPDGVPSREPAGGPAPLPEPVPVPPGSVPPASVPPSPEAPVLEALLEPGGAALVEKREQRLVLEVPGGASAYAEPREAAPVEQPPAMPEPVSSDPVAGVQHASPGGYSAATATRPDAGARTHVVRRGESLWTIASDHIGGDPSPAQVARLVNRLWELNRDRIETGDPDLLIAGTELRMP